MIILPILTTSLIHFSLKSWKNVLFVNLVKPGFYRIAAIAQDVFHDRSDFNC